MRSKVGLWPTCLATLLIIISGLVHEIGGQYRQPLKTIDAFDDKCGQSNSWIYKSNVYNKRGHKHRHGRQHEPELGHGKERGHHRGSGQRIWSGYFPSLGDFPSSLKYETSLGFENGREMWWNCGATLIHSNLAITAAHCVMNSMPNVYAGVVDFSYSAPASSKREAVKTCIHPKYVRQPNNRIYPYDVAVLKLKEPYEYTDYIQPACLSLNFSTDSASSVTTLGYGSFGPNQSQTTSARLRAANMKPATNSYSATTSVLTYTNPQPGHVCPGDSGSGTFYKEPSGKTWVTGVVHTGNDDECQGPKLDNHYSVVTDFYKVPNLWDLILKCMD